MKKTETTLTWLLVIFSLSLITLTSLNSSNQEFNFGNTSSVNNTDLNNVETKENNANKELILGAAIDKYECPECGCELLWTGITKYCQGLNCRTLEKYNCVCCENNYWIYVD